MNEVDWETNMKICDLINGNPEVFCKPTAKAIRNQLKTHSKNPRVLWTTLHLLETCVKNCGRPFHREIATKDFISQLKKTAGKTKKTSKTKDKRGLLLSSREFQNDRVKDKVYSLIQAWGSLHPEELYLYSETYEKMKKKGIDFPLPTPEDKTPLSFQHSASPSELSHTPNPSSNVIPSDVRQRIEEVKSVVPLLESIIEAEPTLNPNENELAVELKTSCERHHAALIDLIQKYSNQGDERILNILLILFDRVEKVIRRFSKGSTSSSRDSFEEDEEFEQAIASSKKEFTGKETPQNSENYPVPQPIQSQSQMQSQQVNSISSKDSDMFRSPAEIGLDLLAKIKSKEAQRNTDPLLDWLLKG